jgi:hypothetical protein
VRDIAPAARRLRRKERKRMATDRLPLAGRRAYRTAHEVLEQGLDLWKMADNKARLALMLLGPLNLLLLAVLYNSDILEAIPRGERAAIVIGLVAYAGLAMTLFFLAIRTLRPEESAPVIGRLPAGHPGGSLRVRHYEDVLEWDLDAYQRAWQRITRAELVAEVLEQAYAVAAANRRKFRALHYLFRGLQGMTALAVLLSLGIAAAIVLASQGETIRLRHGVKVTIPALRGSAAPSRAEPGKGSGRDWARFPPIVDRTTTEEVVALGDVHGGFDRLVRLLQVGGLVRADKRAPGGYAWTGGRRTLVSVGDLIDKGPQSLEVLDLMIGLQRQAPAAGGDVIVTLGNHEAEFLARPGKKKALEFERELAERGIDFHDVAEGRNDYGQFMLNLPLAASVNSWFFAHGGSTSGLSRVQLADRFRKVVDAGRWKDEFLVGDDSLLEARLWWKRAQDQRDLAALPAAHIVFGHDPGAFKGKGMIQAHGGGRLFLIDVGMSPAIDDSQGALLLIDRQRGVDVATALDASGARREVWRGPAAQGS